MSRNEGQSLVFKVQSDLLAGMPVNRRAADVQVRSRLLRFEFQPYFILTLYNNTIRGLSM